MATSVLIPTHGRAPYLRVALASVRAQAPDAEVVVVVHGPDPASAAEARRAGAVVVELPAGGGINVARNAALAAAGGELLAFLDDDVEARPGWLAALERAHAAAPPGVGAFAGAIHARIEGRWRQCGREGGPVTELREAGRYGWGANLAVRRAWVDRVGPFDPVLAAAGDEQEWQDRLRAAGGTVQWVGDAIVDHRRAGADARLRALCRGAYHRGRAARRFGAWRGDAPPLRAELRVLAGALLHGPRFACMMGPVMAAHTWGRVREARDPRPYDDFLSGRSGTVGGRRDVLREAADRVLDRLVPAVETAATPRRRVLVLSAARPGSRWETARAELERSSHDVEVRVADVGGRGKFENLNLLLEAGFESFDWVLVVDDDVDLPGGFLDRFLAAAEAAGLLLAQPAHRRRSHAAWAVTRRRARSVARRTTFVEIGPVTAFAREAARALLPFPPLRMGWGLDAHWSAVARDRGWPIGVVDATPVAHVADPIGRAYDVRAAVEEARAFLAARPYVRRDEVRSL